MNNNHVDAIRQAALTDLDAIMPLFDAARAFMIKAGNPNQWINGYPERKLIESEIEQGHCYVCEDKNERIAATFCFIPGEDPTYKQIEGGTWLNDKPYAVLHRLASDGTLSEVADSCLKWCFLHTTIYESIPIKTIRCYNTSYSSMGSPIAELFMYQTELPVWPIRKRTISKCNPKKIKGTGIINPVPYLYYSITY